MVQIKFSIVTIFILVAAFIAPAAIALPVPANGISNRAAEARKKISNLVKGAKKYVPVFGKKKALRLRLRLQVRRARFVYLNPYCECIMILMVIDHL